MPRLKARGPHQTSDGRTRLVTKQEYEDSKNGVIPLVMSQLKQDVRREMAKDIKPLNKREPSAPIIDFGSPANLGENMRAPSATPSVIIREGRVLARVEVTLPRWQDVRRQKARQATLAARSMLPQPYIKAEPVDDGPPVIDVDSCDPEERPRIIREAVQGLQHPDVKIKKELQMNDEFILNALTWEGIHRQFPIPLPPAIAEHRFSREYISHLYGGNIQQTFPQPAADILEWHGLDDWMFLTLDYNPHAPTIPGRGGLFFNPRRAVDNWETVQRCFVRVKPGQWVYMGQYRMRAGPSLTTGAWMDQSQVVRRAWAEGILTKDWGSRVAIRVYLRKQYGEDYVISDEDHEREVPNLKRIRDSLTAEEVVAAFNRGEEELGTYTMTCVDYDADFIEKLARNAHTFVPSSRKKKGKATDAAKTKRNKKGTGVKREPIEVNSDTESHVDADVEIVESGEDLAPRRIGRPRVKRVRTS